MAAIDERIGRQGYAFLNAPDVRAALLGCGSLVDWEPFTASWGDLPLDEYLAPHARTRRRRFGVFRVAADGSIAREPHQPHVQAAEYNALFGGVERWFAPIDDAIASGAALTAILRFCSRVFSDASGRTSAAWRIEVHQFRIEARLGAPGRPTPEGVHRDGVDFVLVLLINRENIVSGTTTVYDLDGAALGSFTLSRAFDAALVDDHRVAHGVTPVEPLDPARPGYRDVLVVTFRDVGSAGL